MNPRRLAFAAFLGALTACCVGGCVFSEERHASGPGTGDETTNGITGVIASGTNPVAYRLVTLYTASYDPVSGDPPVAVDTTDTNGNYRFANPEPGVYSVEVSNPQRGVAALIQGVEYGPRGTLKRLPAMAMVPPGSLRISLADMALALGDHIYLPGTSRFTEITPTDRLRGFAEITLPEGRYGQVLYRDLSGATLNLAASPVSVASRDTVVLGATDLWKHAARIVINTSASGADVADDLYGFPLLVRLDRTRFDFSQARPDGGDLRFLSADGLREFPYEIETWDTAKGEAAIWVKVDTLRGNDSTQAIGMRWGNSAMTTRSSGSAVFGTDQGFFGVWHLSGRGGDSAQAYRDASAQGNHGTGTGMGSASGISGAIGGAQRFTGGHIAGQFAAAPDGQSAFSASFWVDIHLDSTRMWIMNVGVDTTLAGFHFIVRGDSLAQFGIWDSKKPLDSLSMQNIFSLAPVLGNWVHVASTYESNSRELTTYIDGKVVDRDTIPYFHINFADGFSFGKRFVWDGQSDLMGGLDEVRFQWRTDSAAWIKMSYENQKTSSRMVRME